MPGRRGDLVLAHDGVGALHGEVGWRAHAFPVSVDGIEIFASLVLLAHRRAGARAGWPPWAALVAGPAASIAVAAVGGAGGRSGGEHRGGRL